MAGRRCVSRPEKGVPPQPEPAEAVPGHAATVNAQPFGWSPRHGDLGGDCHGRQRTQARRSGRAAVGERAEARRAPRVPPAGEDRRARDIVPQTTTRADTGDAPLPGGRASPHAPHDGPGGHVAARCRQWPKVRERRSTFTRAGSGAVWLRTAGLHDCDAPAAQRADDMAGPRFRALPRTRRAAEKWPRL